MSICVRFLPDDVTIEAELGEPLLNVAERAGVFIPPGCLTGSCHACEVEVEGGNTIRACITAVTPGRCPSDAADSTLLTINLFVDPTW